LLPLPSSSGIDARPPPDACAVSPNGPV